MNILFILFLVVGVSILVVALVHELSTLGESRMETWRLVGLGLSITLFAFTMFYDVVREITSCVLLTAFGYYVVVKVVDLAEPGLKTFVCDLMRKAARDE
ncbi:MAG: hypothetical protein WCP09_02435 [Candidatus Taylorbacteria bacterium]